MDFFMMLTVPSAGSVCRKASDCSQYSFLSNVIKSNRSDLLPTGYTWETINSYMESLCSPNYCSIASSCDLNYMPFYQSGLTSTDSCCGGSLLNDPCMQTGSLISTCNEKLSCNPSLDVTSNSMFCTVKSAPASTQWIGIILTLIAAALTNLGLNLQKLALRKRHEKVVKRKEHERLGLFYRLTNLKVSVSNFYRSVSNSSLPKFSSMLSNAKDNSLPATVIDNNRTDKDDTSNRSSPHGRVTPSSSHTISPSTRPIGQLETLSASDKDQFQSKLDMANLAKNSRWWLGFIVFALGNFTNFAALNFAAQSLIGPLGSFSLVCNVIIAPLMNGERWTWKDIVGVILIVCGSAVVVIFSGSVHPDYNVCVLLKLFQKPATIVFLILTCSSMFIIFCFIVVVEKNLAFKDASVVVIAETIESGELVNIETNPNSPKLTASSLPGTTENRRRPGGGAINRAKRLSMVISDQIAEDGSNLRIVTINAEDPNNLENRSSDSEDSSDDATQDVGGGPSTRLPNTGMQSNISLASVNGQILDGDGNTIQGLFNKKTEDGTSIHSVALTFKLPQTSTKINDAALDLESCSSVSRAPEKMDYQAPNGQTVVVLPESSPNNANSLWMASWIEYGRKFWIFEKIYQLKLIPRFKNKIPLDSPYVRYGLPFAYAALGGLMATLLTLFAKATIHLITESFQEENQFTSFPPYLFTFITIFCALSQIYWINLGLARYDALLQIPVFYVVWTLFDVIGGGVYYGEFDDFTPVKYGLFSLGVGIIFCGVGILATRLASIADEDKAFGL